MKPWYDNYCFSEDALHTQSKVFNSDMVIYYLRNYIDRGEAPKQMIDPNTKTDYNKMKKLLQLDKLDGDRKGVIRTIAETGQIVAPLTETFSAFSPPQDAAVSAIITIASTRAANLIFFIFCSS